jgi:hypothetical protein
MDLDGGDFHQTQRTFEKGFVGTSIAGGVQVVGRKIYYVFSQDLTPMTFAEAAHGDPKTGRGSRKRAFSLWTAETNLDGSQWEAKCVATAPPTLSVGYKGQVIVGAKRYLAPARLPRSVGQGMLGFGGANIVNKGDAYGLGVTENGIPRAFVNAGQDYLFRGEASTDAAGATADAGDIMPDDSWHHLVEVYDRRQLSLYIDGKLSASMPYAVSPGRNPFPVVIGDGFIGYIGEVGIYDGALPAEEISRLYHQHR